MCNLLLERTWNLMIFRARMIVMNIKPIVICFRRWLQRFTMNQDAGIGFSPWFPEISLVPIPIVYKGKSINSSNQNITLQNGEEIQISSVGLFLASMWWMKSQTKLCKICYRFEVLLSFFNSMSLEVEKYNRAWWWSCFCSKGFFLNQLFKN